MQNSVPQHIAIIMDGNGRWARARRRPRIEGHRVGSRNVRKIALHASDRGVKILTLYAFSHENWSRPSTEVHLLMALLKIYAIRERAILMKHNVRLKVIGDLKKLPEAARKELLATIELTKENTGMILQLALNYGGRGEICEAARALARRIANDELKPQGITEDVFASELQTFGQPDPDLVIRTSGEQRISNFLLWQTAYSEFYFTPKFWPEFSASDLDEAIENFEKRERRYGGLASK